MLVFCVRLCCVCHQKNNKYVNAYHTYSFGKIEGAYELGWQDNPVSSFIQKAKSAPAVPSKPVSVFVPVQQKQQSASSRSSSSVSKTVNNPNSWIAPIAEAQKTVTLTPEQFQQEQMVAKKQALINSIRERQISQFGAIIKQPIIDVSQYDPETRIEKNVKTGDYTVIFPYAGAERYGELKGEVNPATPFAYSMVSHGGSLLDIPGVSVFLDVSEKINERVFGKTVSRIGGGASKFVYGFVPSMGADLFTSNKRQTEKKMVGFLAEYKGGNEALNFGKYVVRSPPMQVVMFEGAGRVISSVGGRVVPKLSTLLGKSSPRNLWLGDTKGGIAPHKIMPGVKVGETNKLLFVGKSGMPEETGYFRVTSEQIYKPGKAVWSYDFPTKPGVSVTGIEKQSVAIEKDILGRNIAKTQGERLLGVKSIVMDKGKIRVGTGASFLESKQGLPLGGLRTETELILKENPLRSLEKSPFFEYVPREYSVGELGLGGMGIGKTIQKQERQIVFRSELFNRNVFPVVAPVSVVKPVTVQSSTTENKTRQDFNRVTVPRSESKQDTGFETVQVPIQKSVQKQGYKQQYVQDFYVPGLFVPGLHGRGSRGYEYKAMGTKYSFRKANYAKNPFDVPKIKEIRF